MLTRLRRLFFVLAAAAAVAAPASRRTDQDGRERHQYHNLSNFGIRNLLAASYLPCGRRDPGLRFHQVTRGRAGCRSSLVTRACDWGILRYAHRPGVHSPTWKLGGARQTRLRAAVSSWTCVGRQAENSAHQNSALDALPRMSCLVAQYRSRPERSSSVLLLASVAMCVC